MTKQSTAVAIVECAHVNLPPNQDGLWLRCRLSLCPQWNPPMENNTDYPLGLLSVIVPALFQLRRSIKCTKYVTQCTTVKCASSNTYMFQSLLQSSSGYKMNSFCLLGINEHHMFHIHALMVYFKLWSTEHLHNIQICYIIYHKCFSRYCDHHQGTRRYS